MFKVTSIKIPKDLPAEEVYSLLFAEPEPPRPDYGWMNPRPRPRRKKKEAKGVREYRRWIKSDEV